MVNCNYEPNSERQKTFAPLDHHPGVTVALLLMVYYLGGRALPGSSERYITYPLRNFQAEGQLRAYTVAPSIGGTLYVSTHQGLIYALVGKDPVGNCPIEWDKERKLFASECNSNTFGRDGAPLPGTSVGMNRFVYTITDDSLIIDTHQVVPWQQAEPATGSQTGQ